MRILNTHGIMVRREGLVIGVSLSRSLLRARMGIANHLLISTIRKRPTFPVIQFDYKPSPLNIVDNGHTIMINYSPGSFITVGGKRYELKQFHFHRPSEEKINGKGYEMTVHLVRADEKGNVAVVAVLLEKGEDNALVHTLWEDLPKEKEKIESEKDVQIDADGLLPPDHSYYTFFGSL